MTDAHKSKIKLNLKKAGGQLRLLEKMVNENRYCIDVAQQVNATIGLLKKINDFILENHLLTCGAKKLNSKKKNERVDFTHELMKAFTLTNR